MDMPVSDQERQRNVSKRRKESGLVTKKLHLSGLSLAEIEAVAESCGYDKPESLSNEEISMLIEYCITATLKALRPGYAASVPDSQDKQLARKVKRVVHHRKRQDDTPVEIATFIAESGYPVPDSLDLASYIRRQRTTDVLLGIIDGNPEQKVSSTSPSAEGSYDFD
ncbi:hypothetical protein [Ferrimonas aestuarii]|uniref:Uncharacterized protein n=1 Tax=Ferrimonas aestuarii TaxID=2569539 RepID=A0A4U1BL41_9GAMM|nr:hypothetical protein [Ferrimonas aestuarii]TKB53082.1 hypothetical protein FCL42_15530 [Ferrimonas aestuarii]